MVKKKEAMQEEILKPVKGGNGKKIQMSVYLNEESYRIAKVLEASTGKSVNERISEWLDVYADKNRETAEKIEARMAAVKELGEVPLF